MNMDKFLSLLTQWANTDNNIISAVIVGSVARNEARPDSDIDVLIITNEIERYSKDLAWLNNFKRYESIRFEVWGPVHCIRVFFDECEAEFNFVKPFWAGIPVDPETAKVVSGGITLIKDTNNLVMKLISAVEKNDVINIRDHKEGDGNLLADIYYSAIHAIPDSLYSPTQKAAWAPNPSKEIYHRWQKRIQEKQPFIAEYKNQLAGFIELEPDGHIDCFYIHPQFQKLGIGGQLFQKVINTARDNKMAKLHVEASKAAKPFFDARGFTLVKTNEVDIRGTKLTNYSMELKNP